MAYNLTITEKADELLDEILYYLVYRLKNPSAADHLIMMIDKVYDQLEKNPLVYAISQDSYLKRQGYHEAIVPEMNYKIIFEVEEDEVTVLGIFHMLENYANKL